MTPTPAAETRTHRRAQASVTDAVTEDSVVGAARSGDRRGHSHASKAALAITKSTTAARSAKANGRAKIRTAIFVMMGAHSRLPSNAVRDRSNKTPASTGPRRGTTSTDGPQTSH